MLASKPRGYFTPCRYFVSAAFLLSLAAGCGGSENSNVDHVAAKPTVRQDIDVPLNKTASKPQPSKVRRQTD